MKVESGQNARIDNEVDIMVYTISGAEKRHNITKRGHTMKTARIFTNGRSQAVRLPKEFRFDGEEVYVNKVQGIVMLIPKDDPWKPLVNSLEHFTEDFMERREQLITQEREGL